MSDEQQPRFCGQCGTSVQSGDTFCGECGATILPPPPQAEQVIPEPVAAVQGDMVRSNRRALLLVGAVGMLLVLLVGGAIALLGSGDEERSGPSEDQPEEVAGTPREQEEYGTTESATPSSTASGPSWMSDEEIALLEEFGRNYDEAVRREDWQATYSMLHESSQQEFTEVEWAEKNQALKDANGPTAPLESVIIEQDEEQTDVPVTVRLTYEDGTEETIMAMIPMVVEDPSDSGVPKRFLTEEEISELERLPTSSSYRPTPDEAEADAREAAGDYYRAAGREDWAYTYENLDSETQARFTREEWFKKNQWFANNSQVIYHILSVEATIQRGLRAPIVEVRLRLTGEDGSSSTRTTYFLYENGSWKHRFGQEEYDLFMPGSSMQEFLKAQRGNRSRGAEKQNTPSFDEQFPEKRRAGGEEI